MRWPLTSIGLVKQEKRSILKPFCGQEGEMLKKMSREQACYLVLRLVL